MRREPLSLEALPSYHISQTDADSWLHLSYITRNHADWHKNAEVLGAGLVVGGCADGGDGGGGGRGEGCLVLFCQLVFSCSRRPLLECGLTNQRAGSHNWGQTPSCGLLHKLLSEDTG